MENPELPIINRKLIVIGITALFIGVLIYFTNRPEHVYFIQKLGLDLRQYRIPNLLGPLNNNLPAFIHVFAFCLITAGLLPSPRRGCYAVCLLWLMVNLCFEIGQKYGDFVVQHIPEWAGGLPVLENLKSYFLYGTFDLWDLVAAAIGAGAACLTIFSIIQGRDELWKRTRPS